MTQLNCSVDHCMYNKEKSCCKGDIMIEGKDAMEKRSTCCGSFRERTGNSLSNSMATPSKNIEVDCEAEKCVYNHANKCDADQIGISGGNACHCEETECASFQPE
ncbi:DUF1540 domain-containing protein [Lachnospiraceae bacterium ZAX-1]